MSLKRKLLVTIIMFCAAVSLLMVGVWAISSDSFDIGGTIQFFASDVNVTISGSMVGAKTNPTYTTLTYKPATSTTAETKPTQAALNSWKNKIDFKSTADDIILTITITNNGLRPIYASLVDQSSATSNILKAFQAANETYSLDTQKEISPNGSLIFTITFSVDDIATEINGGYKFFVNLEDERADFDYVATPGLVYTYSSSAPYTATVSAYEGSATNVIVPAKVRHGGIAYPVTKIRAKAFKEYGQLTSVILPEGLLVIEERAFANTGLTSIVIPNSVTQIDYCAFYGCPLTSVEIPFRVQSLGEEVFLGCEQLTKIFVNRPYHYGITELGGPCAFDGCHADLKIYVPANSVSAYKAATNWSEYASKIYSIDDMPASVSAVENVIDEIVIPASYGKKED